MTTNLGLTGPDPATYLIAGRYPGPTDPQMVGVAEFEALRSPAYGALFQLAPKTELLYICVEEPGFSGLDTFDIGFRIAGNPVTLVSSKTVTLSLSPRVPDNSLAGLTGVAASWDPATTAVVVTGAATAGAHLRVVARCAGKMAWQVIGGAVATGGTFTANGYLPPDYFVAGDIFDVAVFADNNLFSTPFEDYQYGPVTRTTATVA